MTNWPTLIAALEKEHFSWFRKHMGELTPRELEIVWRHTNCKIQWLRSGSRRRSQIVTRRKWRVIRNLSTRYWHKRKNI